VRLVEKQVQKRKNAEAHENAKKRGAYQPSTARFVRRFCIVQDSLAKKTHRSLVTLSTKAKP
jgi:hypothetical protein